MADGPLIGFRILDLTAVISGPFCTQLLGDLGADVIKIEPPEGDSMRRNVGPQRGGLTAAFLNFNRNKRSIVIDIKKEHGRDLVRRLAHAKRSRIGHQEPPRSKAYRTHDRYRAIVAYRFRGRRPIDWTDPWLNGDYLDNLRLRI